VASPPQGNSGSSVLAVDNRKNLTSSDGSDIILLTVPSSGLVYEIGLRLLPNIISSGASVTYTFYWTENGSSLYYQLTATTGGVLQSNTILIQPDANTKLEVAFYIASGSTNSDVACVVKGIQ
jgi:hypothetical protein